MTEFLKKYNATLGIERVVDELNDVFGFKAIRLNSVLFDDSNIALKSEIGTVASNLSALTALFNAHVNDNNIDINSIRADLLSLYESVRLLGEDIRRFWLDLPQEETIVATAGQQIFLSTLVTWVPNNAVQDIKVYKNGVKLRMDTSGGSGFDYRKLDANRIQTTLPMVEGDRITVRQEKTTINGLPTSYYFQHIGVVSGSTAACPDRYSLGSDQLTVFRNGVLVLKSALLGLPQDRYEETSPFFVTLGTPMANEVVSVLNQLTPPTYRQVLSGQTGTLLTIPSYVVGSGRLKVWRNGILMHTTIGEPADRYTELDSTHIQLNEAANIDEIFVVENSASIPGFREEITGVIGNMLTLSNSYTIGDDHLLVFRNGTLMFKSLTLGSPTDRYVEATTTSITLEEAAIASEIFSVIYL